MLLHENSGLGRWDYFYRRYMVSVKSGYCLELIGLTTLFSLFCMIHLILYDPNSGLWYINFDIPNIQFLIEHYLKQCSKLDKERSWNLWKFKGLLILDNKNVNIRDLCHPWNLHTSNICMHMVYIHYNMRIIMSAALYEHIRMEWWLVAIGFSVLIFCYDEAHKFIIRKCPGGNLTV